MADRQRYRKKPDRFVTAVQLDLETDGFTYDKWGDEQKCKAGDWLVKNHSDGETYTIEEDTFAGTYRQLSPGVYFKDAPIWAEVATDAGTVETKEGTTRYEAGDYLVSNKENGSDAYAIERDSFEEMYELDD